MGENIKKFADNYDIAADAALKKAEEKLGVFKKTREQALKLTTPISEGKTLGALAAEIFPENGGMNSELFTNVYATATIDAEERKVINELVKVKSAPTLYKQALANKELGGIGFFNKLMQAVGAKITSVTTSSPEVTFKKLIGEGSTKTEEKKIESLYDFISDTLNDVYISYPPRSLDKTLVYYAVVENGNPIGKTTGAESPVNETKLTSPPTAGESVINEKKESTPKQVEASAVNPEKATKEVKESSTISAPSVVAEVPKEPVALPENKAISINIEAKQSPAKELEKRTEIVSFPEKTAGAVTTEPTSLPGPITNQIEKKESPLNPEKTQVVEKLESANQTLKETNNNFFDSTSKTEVISSVNELTKEKSLEKKKEIFKNTETSRLESSTSQLNDRLLEKQSEIAAKTGTPVASEQSTPINLIEALTALKEKIKKRQERNSLFDSLNEKKEEPTLESKVTTESEKATLPIEKEKSEIKEKTNVLEITKATPSLPVEMKKEEKAVGSIVEQTPVGSEKTSGPSEESNLPKSREESAPEKTAGPDGRGEAVMSQRLVGLDQLEGRLARIEMLLTGPLDVKIVD